MPEQPQEQMPPDFLAPDKESTAITPVDPQAIAKLRRLTGERMERSEYAFISRLRWHKHGDEKKGFYIYRGMDDTGHELVDELGETVSGIFLVKREYLDMWKGDVHFFTHRFDTWKESLTLFQKNVKNDADKTEVERGTAKELREKYKVKDPVRGDTNLLKLHQVWYVTMNSLKDLKEEVVEIDLKGDALKEFFEYHKEINTKKLSVAAVKTKIVLLQKTQGSVTYVVPTFSMEVQLTDFGPVFDKIGEIYAGLEAMKAQFAPKEEDKTEEVKEAL